MFYQHNNTEQGEFGSVMVSRFSANLYLIGKVSTCSVHRREKHVSCVINSLITWEAYALTLPSRWLVGNQIYLILIISGLYFLRDKRKLLSYSHILKCFPYCFQMFRLYQGNLSIWINFCVWGEVRVSSLDSTIYWNGTSSLHCIFLTSLLKIEYTQHTK